MKKITLFLGALALVSSVNGFAQAENSGDLIDAVNNPEKVITTGKDTLEANVKPKKVKKPSMFNGSTNIQVFYDFGVDRKCVTTTIEGFYMDPWGDTFFFIDHDFPTQNDTEVDKKNALSPVGTYWEIARNLNFWKNTKAGFLSLHVEYNGGVYRGQYNVEDQIYAGGYGVNHAFLGGLDFGLHTKNFKNLFNLQLMYKYIMGQDSLSPDQGWSWTIPMQFTFIWALKDLFRVKGLTFSGFADVWGEKHWCYKDTQQNPIVEKAYLVFISEPQLWYNVGQWFNCDNLNVGGEVELSYDFGVVKGFMCRPCLGVKWVF